MTPAERTEAFHKIHDLGVDRFPRDWLRCNERAVEIAQKIGVPYHREDIRCLLSCVVFSLLNYCRPVGLPDDPTIKVLETIKPPK